MKTPTPEPADRHEKIIDLIRNAKSVAPPDSLTGNVMRRIENEEPLRGYSFIPQAFGFKGGMHDGGRKEGNALSLSESAFCFSLTGFFYCIFSLSMTLGFARFGSGHGPVGILVYQALFTFVLGLLLIVLGFALYRFRMSGIRIIRYGTVFFMLSILIGSLIMHLFIPLRLSLVMVWPFAITGLVMGYFLSRVIDRIQENETVGADRL